MAKKRKLVIEIPEEMDERRFYGLFGIEGWIRRDPFADFAWVKTERCNNCGECCKREHLVPDELPKDKSGACVYLNQIGGEWECSLGVLRPRGCCTSDPVASGVEDAEEFCSIRYKKVKLE